MCYFIEKSRDFQTWKFIRVEGRIYFMITCGQTYTFTFVHIFMCARQSETSDSAFLILWNGKLAANETNLFGFLDSFRGIILKYYFYVKYIYLHLFKYIYMYFYDDNDNKFKCLGMADFDDWVFGSTVVGWVWEEFFFRIAFLVEKLI